MKIIFDEIPASGLELELSDQSWFPDQEVTRAGPVRASLFLERRHNRVLLSGRFSVMFEMDCDRCLACYRTLLESDFSLDLEYQPDGGPEVLPEEHGCSRSEMDVVCLRRPEIELFSLLRQQVILTLPAKRLCDEECRGLCVRCGGNLNEGGCVCSGGDISSPFSVLKGFKCS